jgi:nucleotide sugar dehydrogenase
MRVCVVGLGKIGLPLAVQYASKGHHVVGADIDARVVDAVNRGECPHLGEDRMPELLAEAHARGLLRATTDVTEAVAASEAVVVVVPLLVGDDGEPRFGALDAATAAIAAGLQPGTLVCYETTIPTGTTRNRFTPVLAAGSGLVPGESLFVCFSPERVFTGRVFGDLRRYPKLLGGIDAASAAVGRSFYEAVLDFDERSDLARPNGVWDLGTAEAAELAKLAETTYRDLNIAFANELARFSDRIGIDVYQVIDAANSQPFSHLHRPGVAVGGHCIPVYPRLYLLGDPEAVLPRASRLVNEAMPGYVVDRLATALGGDLRGLTVVVLGAAYRFGVKETAFSGVFPLVEELTVRGATPLVHDPLYDDDELRRLGLAPCALPQACDAAIVHTDHHEYRSLTPASLPGAKVVVDGRAILPTESFAATGTRLIVLGRGATG